MSHGILRSGAVYGIANLLSAGVPFLLLPILTRALTPAQYGEVIAFFMLVSICASGAGLSLQASVGVRWLDRSRGDPRVHTGTSLLLVLISTGLAAGLAAAAAPFFGIELSRPICALAAVVAGNMVLQGIRFAIWQSTGRPLPAAGLQVASAVLNALLSLGGVLVLEWGGAGRIAGATLAGVLVGIGCVVSLLYEGAATGVSRTEARSLLRFGVPLMPHALAGALLANADRFAVSAQFGTGALGVYGAASQLGLILGVIADAAVKAYTPTMYRLLASSSMRDRLRLVAVTYLSIPVSIAAALALWGAYSMAGPYLLGARYTDAIALSIWFLLGGAASAVYLNLAGLFFFSGKTEWISVSTMTASCLTLLIAPFAVEAAALHGGGAAYFGGQVALLAATWLWSRRIQPMPWGRPRLALRVLRRPRGKSA
jgi:O-antigen/teichoic acid export membrane protein